MQPEKGQTRQDLEADAGDLFDYAALRDYLRFGTTSIRRHRGLVVFLLCSVIGLAVLYLATFPKTYRVETRILAQRNQVMASLGNPGRSMPGEFDAPTRAASETILNHTNLVSLVRQTNLLERWEQTKAPVVRFKDRITARLQRTPVSEQDKIDGLVYLLEKKLLVTTGEGTIDISLDWNHPQVAYGVVEAAQQNFLEARHVSEISTIAEAISILEGHAAAIRDTIEADIEELQKASSEAVVGKPLAARPPPPTHSEGLAELRVLILAKRSAIADLEEFRRKRLAELQAQLAQQRAVYAEQHPLIISTMQSIDALLEDSPKIVELRKEELSLVRSYEKKGGKAVELERRAAGRDGTRLEAHRAVADRIPQPSGAEDPALGVLRTRLQFSLQKYHGLVDRIESARIELDAARAAFKYRYSVIRPPQIPKGSIKPKAAAVFAMSVVGGLLLGIFTAILLDLSAGVVLTRGQVERQLDLPVLTVVNKP